MFTLPYTTPPDDLLKLYIANQDATDFLIGNSIQIRNSTDFPYFADSEVGDVSMSLISLNDEFNPLNPNNFFREHGPNSSALGLKWDQTGYKIPVVIASKGQTLFAGHIIDINVDLPGGKVDIVVADISKDYREKDLEAGTFGIERFLRVEEGEQVGEYKLPETAAPIPKDTVEVRYDDLGPDKIAPQATDIHSEGIYSLHEYVVQPDEPAITTVEALTSSNVDLPTVSVGFYEPHRWRKVKNIVEDVIDLIDPDQDLERSIDIPEFKTDNDQFVTNGRVGWHLEGGKSITQPVRWGYRGFVRDFIINPDNKDVFFVYGGAFHNEPTLVHYDRIIHYINDDDRYVEYKMADSYNVHGNSNSYNHASGAANPQRQSLWRIATDDFQTFYIMAATGYNKDEIKAWVDSYPDDTLRSIEQNQNIDDHPVRLYEYGPSFNSAHPNIILGNPVTSDKNKPKIFRWHLSTNAWTLVDWNNNYGGDLSDGKSPQLSDFIGLTKNLNAPLTQTLRNPENMRADTRNPFAIANNRLLYKSQTNQHARIIQYNIVNNNVSEIHSTNKSNCNDGWGYNFGHDDTHVYICEVSLTSIKLIIVPIGSNTPTTELTHTSGLPSDCWNVSDIVVVTHSGVTHVYGVLQHGDREYTKGRLILMRSSKGWQLETIKDYDYYALGAKGGVALDNYPYYFEGSIYQQISNYDSMSERARQGSNPSGQVPRTGRLIKVDTMVPRDIVDNGLVWRSAVLPRDWDDEPNALTRFHNKLYGAHNSIIAPLRTDGNAIHMVAGYGDIQESMKLTPEVYIGDDLVEFPADHIDNWQWIQWGKEQPMRLDRVVISEGEKAWDFLRMLAELTRCSISMNAHRFQFKRQPGVYSKLHEPLTSTSMNILLENSDGFPILGKVLVGNELIRIGNNLSIAERGVYPTKKSTTNHPTGTYVYPIDVTADNYSAEQNIIHIGVDGKYEEIYNQIKGQVRHAIEYSVYPNDQKYTEDDSGLVELIGELPFDIDTQLLSHHQLWWRDLLTEHYLNEFSSLSFDISLVLQYNPDIEVGHVIAIDIRHPARDGTEWIWKKGSMDWIAARVVQVENNFGIGDDAWTTSITARTLPLD